MTRDFKLPYGWTLVSLLAGGFLLLALVGAGAIWLNQRIENYALLVGRAEKAKTLSLSLLSVAQDSETGQRGYLLVGDPEYLEPYNSAVRRLPEVLGAIDKLAKTGGISPSDVATFKRLTDRRMEIIGKSLELFRDQGRDAALAYVRIGEGKQVMDELREAVARVQAPQSVVFNEGTQELRENNTLLLWLSLAGLALTVLLAAASVFIVREYLREVEAGRAELEEVNTGLDETVAERTAEVMRANQEIQRFAYIVSHDLRSPLVNVMGFTSELESIRETLSLRYSALAEAAPDLAGAEANEAINKDMPEAIAFIRASTGKMDRLINAILKLSREGQRAMTPSLVKMGEVAHGIAGSLRQQTEKAGARIEVGELPNLVTDRVTIEQILSNVVENAVKYLDPERPGEITIDGHERGSYVEYRVADNGRGIDKGDHERVFELFRRAGAQDTAGEGLGLAFVRASVYRLGGTIDLQSEPARGSTFTLRFPKVFRTRKTI